MADMKTNVFRNGSIVPFVVSDYQVKQIDMPVNDGTGIKNVKLNKHTAKLTHDPSKPMEGDYFAKFNPAAVTTFGVHSYPGYKSMPKGEKWSPGSKFIDWDTFKSMLRFACYHAPYASNQFPLPGTVTMQMWLGKDATENRIDKIGGPEMMKEFRQMRDSADHDLDLDEVFPESKSDADHDLISDEEKEEAKKFEEDRLRELESNQAKHDKKNKK